MYKIEVKNSKGEVIRTRHFSSKKEAEKYEDIQYRYNPVASNFDFIITKVK